MLKIEFTLKEIDTLEHERYQHPDSKVQRKVEVIYLKSHGPDLVNPHSKTVIFLDIAIQVLLQLQLKSVFRSGFVSLSQSICDIVAPVQADVLVVAGLPV